MDKLGTIDVRDRNLGLCSALSETEGCGQEHVLTWPHLSQLGLPRSILNDRRHSIGGSDANIIFSGDDSRIIALWREKRGEVQPEDLTSLLPVMLGSWTEPFNRQWYERASGEQVRAVGARLICPKYDWRRCTVDGLIESSGAVWEAKHTSAFAKAEEVLERYSPQLQHNMAVAGSDRAVLSVIFGNHKFEIIEVAADWLYQLELLEAEEQFWDCVLTGKEPVPIVPPSAPKPIGTREMCFEGNNEWASAAYEWLRHRKAAKAHASATALLKGLIEPDVRLAFGHGIEAKRSRAGAISIRELAL